MAPAYPEQCPPNLSQYQQSYYDAAQALRSQQVRLAPGELEKIVEAVVSRLVRFMDPQKLAAEFDPIC